MRWRNGRASVPRDLEPLSSWVPKYGYNKFPLIEEKDEDLSNFHPKTKLTKLLQPWDCDECKYVTEEAFKVMQN